MCFPQAKKEKKAKKSKKASSEIGLGSRFLRVSAPGQEKETKPELQRVQPIQLGFHVTILGEVPCVLHAPRCGTGDSRDSRDDSRSRSRSS